MRRSEIYWCDLEPRRGHEQGEKRPVVIVSADPYNLTRSPLVGIVPLTTAAPKNPIHVALAKEDTGMKTDSVALVDHARFLDRTRLSPSPAGLVTNQAMQRIDQNLARVLGLS